MYLKCLSLCPAHGRCSRNVRLLLAPVSIKISELGGQGQYSPTQTGPDVPPRDLSSVCIISISSEGQNLNLGYVNNVTPFIDKHRYPYSTKTDIYYICDMKISCVGEWGYDYEKNM